MSNSKLKDLKEKIDELNRDVLDIEKDIVGAETHLLANFEQYGNLKHDGFEGYLKRSERKKKINIKSDIKNEDRIFSHSSADVLNLKKYCKNGDVVKLDANNYRKRRKLR